MFDQLIWYFCLAFSSACACAGQRLPQTGGRAGPSPAPAPRPGARLGCGGSSSCPPAAAPHLCLVQCATSSSPGPNTNTCSPQQFSEQKKQNMCLPALFRLQGLEALQDFATTAPPMQLQPFAGFGRGAPARPW